MAEVDQAAAAVLAALNFEATPESRQAATVFLDSIKSGDVRTLGKIGFELSKQNRPLEVRHHGLKLLQHLLRARWEELNPEERQSFAGMVAGMITEFAQPNEQWSIKSQTAMLAVEIARKDGLSVFQNSLATISDMGPVHAEIVALVLRWLPEDVVVYNEDLGAPRKKSLVVDLVNNVSEINQLMFRILEKHFTAGQQNPGEAKQHAAVVTAVLNAVLVYAQWAPVDGIFDSGLAQACGYLLNVPDFRVAACSIFRELVSRRCEVPCGRTYDILLPVCDAYFQNLHSGGNDDLEFAECLCSAMVAIGYREEQRTATYCKQMLAFLQHPDFSVHVLAVPVWAMMMVDLKNDHVKAIVEPVLDTASHYFSRETQDEFATIADYSAYRQRLIELIRLSTVHKPVLGITKALQRLNILLSIPQGQSISSQDLANFQGSIGILDATLMGLANYTDELNSVMEGFLQRVISVHWTDEKLVDLHAQLFDALGPYLKHVPNVGPSVVEKLFQLLLSVPIVPKGKNPAPSKARMQVCTSLLRVASATKSALLPHLQSIAETVTKLLQNKLLGRGEQVTICEFFLIVAGREKYAETLDWLLAPYREQWSKAEFQQHISGPASLVQLLSERKDDVYEKLYSDKGMWYIYHSIAFFEKAMKRCPLIETSETMFAHHLSWILPSLLQILRCLHALWIPSVRSTLPLDFHQAMQLSVKEQAAIIGETNASVEGAEDELRSWLRGVRDNGYSFLSQTESLFHKTFFAAMGGMAGNFSVALVESVSAMEFRHLRQMVHLVVLPLVRKCPPPLWDECLGRILPPILVCAHGKLSSAWDSLIKDGTPKTDTSFAPSSDLKTELVEERILRELTREICSLLLLFASDSNSILMFLIRYNDAAFAALHLAIQSMNWPDAEVVQKNASFCKAVINLAVNLNDPQLTEIVAKDMFAAVIRSLTLESNATIQTVLLGLLRQIIIDLSARTSSPKEMLMSMLSITQERYITFEESFKAASNGREQQLCIRNLLLAGGGDHLKALKPLKLSIISTTSAPALHARLRRRLRPEVEDAGPIGLASIL